MPLFHYDKFKWLSSSPVKYYSSSLVAYLLLLHIHSAHLWMVLETRGFLRLIKHKGKSSLSKGCYNPLKNLGVIIHFSEIIKLQFGANCQLWYDFYSFLKFIVSV